MRLKGLLVSFKVLHFYSGMVHYNVTGTTLKYLLHLQYQVTLLGSSLLNFPHKLCHPCALLDTCICVDVTRVCTCAFGKLCHPCTPPGHLHMHRCDMCTRMHADLPRVQLACIKNWIAPTQQHTPDFLRTKRCTNIFFAFYSPAVTALSVFLFQLNYSIH